MPLEAADARWWNPPLPNLGKCRAVGGEDVPAWMDMLREEHAVSEPCMHVSCEFVTDSTPACVWSPLLVPYQ